MDVIRIDGDFCPADVRVVELVDSLHSQVASIEAENAELRERIKMLERDLTIARECIEMFMVCDPSDSFRVKAEDESDEYHTGTEAIERIDAALAGGKE